MTETAETAPVISERRAGDPPAAWPEGADAREGETTRERLRQSATRNPLRKWWQDMRGDISARKARSDGRWWLMRWMKEQPTSPRDYLDFLFHQRYMRPDGRDGWGLNTEAWLIDGLHALLFRAFGLFIGFPVSLACYALAWMSQRVGRALLLTALMIFVKNNLSTWLS